MLLRLEVRDLFIATCEVEPERVAGRLPWGVEPALADGGALVSLLAFRNEAVRLGRLRAPGFAQVTVRTYVTVGGDPGVFFLAMRTTLPGMAGAFLGAPFRPARIRVAEGIAFAPGLGVELRYRRAGPPGSIPALESGPLGSQDVGFFFAAGLRRIVTEHEPFAWEQAELAGAPHLDPVLALGFDVKEPLSTLYAERTGFRVRLPPERVPL